MPANLMSKATSCGPTSRRSMVVLVNGSVAEFAAYAETVLVMVCERLSVVVFKPEIGKVVNGENASVRLR